MSPSKDISHKYGLGKDIMQGQRALCVQAALSCDSVCINIQNEHNEKVFGCANRVQRVSNGKKSGALYFI